MGQKRNKYCPYKKTCSGICYGSQPCDFADAFDEMARSMVWWKKKARALEQKLKQTKGWSRASMVDTFFLHAKMVSMERRAGGSVKKTVRLRSIASVHLQREKSMNSSTEKERKRTLKCMKNRIAAGRLTENMTIC